MLLVKAVCPNCGAPLGLRDGQTHVICAYCDLSLRVESAAPGAANATGPSLTSEQVSPEDIRRVKELVLDGKRADAIALYSKVANLSPGEAEQAVEQLFIPELFKILRRMPINALGCSIALLLIAGAAAGLTWAVLNLADDPGNALLAIVCALALFFFVRWLVPKALSALVARFGAKGRARVHKRSVIKGYARGGSVVLVLFEVQPEAGGATFYDEEALLVLDASLPKLEPGNVIAVRYDEPRRTRVFPVTPIQVLGRA